MVITKKSLPRRTVLRGIGVTLALPLARQYGAGTDGAHPESGGTRPPPRCVLRSERHGVALLATGRGRPPH